MMTGPLAPRTFWCLLCYQLQEQQLTRAPFGMLLLPELMERPSSSAAASAEPKPGSRCGAELQ